jgi:probable HAF family extracellular repeat protein
MSQSGYENSRSEGCVRIESLAPQKKTQLEDTLKHKIRILTALVLVFAALALPLASSAQSTSTQNQRAQHHHYKLIDIPALGGPNSSFGVGGYTSRIINSQGTAIAQADTPIPDPFSLVGFDFLVNHPVQWRNGVLTDLGALPGVNSGFAFWVNSRGWVAGLSENGQIDRATGFPETTAVLWKDGEIIELGTLGGTVSSANAVNNRGQVVGGALNAIPDPFSATFTQCPPCIFETFPFYFFPVTTQSHAFLWQDGNMHDLGTLGGPDSVAWFVNESGQVAGQSTIDSIPNANGLLTVDPFLEEHGKMVDVGNLGGTFSFVSGLNNRGQMTGTMTLPGDSVYHAFFWDRGVLTDIPTLGGDFGNANTINAVGGVVGFASNQGNQSVFGYLWKNGVITNLGTVDGDQCSAAHDLNSNGQVVGESSPSCFNLPGVHAFLWENGGPMVDLNTLVTPGSELESAGGVAINDRGEITGDRVLPNGDTHGFILIPCDANHPNVEGCDYGLVDANPAAQVLPTQVTQPSAAGSAKLSPLEFMTRFRSLRTSRNRHLATPTLAK